MVFLRKHRFDFLIIVGLIALYLLSRLISLTTIPIFTDEAIYLRWAEIAKNDANWRFISLTDGKQPLFVWLVMITLHFFHDPLVAGRIVSVFAGLGSIIGLILLSYELFKNKTIAFLSGFLYIIFPFALIYDRMVIYDSLVGTFAIAGLYCLVLLVRRMRLDIALITGFVTGAAVLNKTSGFFTIYLLPVMLILFDWRKKLLTNRLLKFVGLSAIVILLTYLFYAILRLSPFYYIINEKNGLFVYPVKEWIHHPFLQFWPNTRALTDWFISYMGIPFVVLALGAFVVSKDFLREKLLLLLWFLIPFGLLILFGKQLYPRYILFMSLSLLPLISFGIVSLLKQWRSPVLKVLILLLSLSFSVISSVLILVSPSNAPIPQADKGQYISGWPSGYGIKESVDYFRKQASDHQIMIATEGTFGLLPFAYEVYLVNNPNIVIRGYWPIGPQIPDELAKLAKSKDVYVVFYQECPSCPGKGIAPPTWPVRQVVQYKKLEPNTYLTIYQVLPQ